MLLSFLFAMPFVHRNPDGEERAWCYTTDPEKRWEFCSVPACVDPLNDIGSLAVDICFNCTTESCGSEYHQQSDYRGTINKTIGGRDCQRWDSQEPHDHSRTRENYPYAGLDENYCRNMDGEDGAWCYTTDPDQRWELCNVPICDVGTLRGSSLCGLRSLEQTDYRGNIAVTASGKECQVRPTLSVVE